MSDAPHKFDFHIGDYVRDTEDLSLTQHGIYLKLMIWYYSTAKPIPNDLDRIFCRIRAASKEERVSTEFILTEFFRLENGKWVHKRIEEELANWGMATECARKSAKKRWEEYRKNKELANADAVKPQCDGNANPHASLLPVTCYLLPKSKPLARSAKAPTSIRLGEGQVLETIPLIGEAVAEVCETHLAELSRLYPKVDPLPTLREIRGWNLAKPDRRKTSRGIAAHINSWFQREQNRG